MLQKNDHREIGELYPQLTLEQRREAEENLRRYLIVVRRIFAEVQERNPKFLTQLRNRAKLREQKALK